MPEVDVQLTVWQAEWCPHSAKIRERLTELMVPFVAMPVEPESADRSALQDATGQNCIPALVFADGTVLAGDDETILSGLDARFSEGPEAKGHRVKDAEH